MYYCVFDMKYFIISAAQCRRESNIFFLGTALEPWNDAVGIKDRS